MILSEISRYFYEEAETFSYGREFTPFYSMKYSIELLFEYII